MANKSEISEHTTTENISSNTSNNTSNNTNIYSYNFKTNKSDTTKAKTYDPVIFKDSAGSKKDKRRAIVYRFLHDLSDIEENQYYKDLFIEMSTGKFPHGYSYDIVDDSMHKLIYKKRSTFHICSLATKDSKAAINLIKDFMRKQTLVQPYEEKSDLHTPERVEKITWFKISRKVKEQKMYLDIYTKSLIDKYSLSTSEIEDLKNTIDQAKLIGYLSDQHVIFENHRIVDIKGLTFNNIKRCFLLDTTNLQNSSRSNKSKEDDTTPSSRAISIDGWRTYIRELKKDIKSKISSPNNENDNTENSLTANDDASQTND